MSDQYVFGIHAVEALLKKRRHAIKQVWISATRRDQRMQALIDLIQKAQVNYSTLSAADIDSRFPDSVHQGIVAATEPLPTYHENDIPTLITQTEGTPLILILDGVTDPHNLGACLRNADAAGVDCVIIPKDRSAALTPTVSKVACGAAETVPLIRVTNLVRTLETLKQAGIWIFGAAADAQKTLYQLDGQRPLALVLGAEGSGMRRLTKEHCDDLFSIPMQGSVSSLNVSVATGISLFEMIRQRH